MDDLYALAEAVVAEAAAKGLTLATAESLTAGLIAATVADVPGASKVLLGGVVSYAFAVKQAVLGVEGIGEDQAVSEELRQTDGRRRAKADGSGHCGQRNGRRRAGRRQRTHSRGHGLDRLRVRGSGLGAGAPFLGGQAGRAA